MKSAPTIRWLLLAIPVLALFGLIAWRIAQKRAEAAGDAKAAQARKNAPANVDTVPVSRRTITKTFDAVGSIEAPATVQISPKVTGRLLTLLVREGDQVKRGQVLATIDPQETLAALRQKQPRSQKRVRALPRRS